MATCSYAAAGGCELAGAPCKDECSCGAKFHHWCQNSYYAKKYGYENRLKKCLQCFPTDTDTKNMSDEDLANWGINRSDLLPWPPGDEREDSGISFLSSERPSVAEARAIEARTRAASRERRRQQVQAQEDAERDFASTFPIPELDNNAAIGGSNFVPAADSVAATAARPRCSNCQGQGYEMIWQPEARCFLCENCGNDYAPQPTRTADTNGQTAPAAPATPAAPDATANPVGARGTRPPVSMNLANIEHPRPHPSFRGRS